MAVIDMIIDFHTHIFPDSLAQRAVSKLAGVSGIPNQTNGTLQDTLDKMTLWGVDMAVCHHIATKPNQEPTINTWAISTASEKIVPFASLHWQSDHVLERVLEIKQAGFHGIKLHPDYQDFLINDKRLYPIYDLCSDLGLILMFHAGFDYVSPDFVHAAPKASAEVIREFPKCKIVLAHLGGFDMWNEVDEYIAGKDIYMDTAMCPGRIDPALMKKIIDRHNPDKILFGSDCPWQTPKQNREFLEKLNLSSDRMEKILSGNAISLLNL
jgi:predicted TIM-barrel fold metal-dependent hydrolase